MGTRTGRKEEEREDEMCGKEWTGERAGTEGVRTSMMTRKKRTMRKVNKLKENNKMKTGEKN